MSSSLLVLLFSSMSLISSQFIGTQFLIVIPNPPFPYNGFPHCKQFKQLMLNKNGILFAEIIEDSSFVRFILNALTDQSTFCIL